MAHPDGWLFFTDPGYGSLYEGTRRKGGDPRPIQKEAIHRCDGPGKIEKVADEPFKPNGLCFSPDFKKVYVTDTGISHYDEARSVIWVYDVDGKRLRKPRVFASMEMNGKAGVADGIRCDEDGNV
jgi:gluconolactonase